MAPLSLPCLYCKTQHVLLCLTVYRYICIWLWDTTYLSSAVQRQKRRRKMSPVRFIFISRVRILLCLVRNIQPQCITESSIIQTVSFSKLINSTQNVSNTFIWKWNWIHLEMGRFFYLCIVVYLNHPGESVMALPGWELGWPFIMRTKTLFIKFQQSISCNNTVETLLFLIINNHFHTLFRLVSCLVFSNIIIHCPTLFVYFSC